MLIFLLAVTLASNAYAASVKVQNNSEILAFINKKIANIKMRQCLVDSGTKFWEKNKFIKSVFKLDQGTLVINTINAQESTPHGKLLYDTSKFEVKLDALVIPLQLANASWEYPSYFDAECPGFTAMPASITLSCRSENCIQVKNGEEPLETLRSLKIFIPDSDGKVISNAMTNLINLNKKND